MHHMHTTCFSSLGTYEQKKKEISCDYTQVEKSLASETNMPYGFEELNFGFNTHKNYVCLLFCVAGGCFSW